MSKHFQEILTPANSQMIFIDQQPQMAFGVQSIDRQTLKNNVVGLAKAAKAGIDVSLLPAYLAGMLVAMVSGVAAIGLVKRLTSKGRFGAFSYYCWGAGALTMILSLIF